MSVAEDKRKCILAVGDSNSVHVWVPARMMREAGYRVVLADTMREVDPRAREYFDAVYSLTEPVQRILLKSRSALPSSKYSYGVQALDIETPASLRPYCWRLLQGWLKGGQLQAVVARERPGLIHAQHFTTCALTIYYFLKRVGFSGQRRPGVLGHLWSYTPRFPGIRRREMRLAGACDHIHTSSESVARIYREHYGVSADRISVFVRGVDVKKFAPCSPAALDAGRRAWGIPSGKFVIIHNRHLSPKYRVDIAVEVAIELAKRGHDVFMVLVRGPISDQAYEEQLTARMKEGGLGGRFAFLPGALSAEEMAVALQLSHCSINTVPHDAFAVSILESMYCRSVPVLRDLESYYSFVTDGENGFLCGGTGIDEFVKKTERLITNPEMRNRMAETGMRLVAAKGSDERYSHSLLDLVKKCWHE